MATKFYSLKKRFDKLGEMSESAFIRWMNDNVLRGVRICSIDSDETWESIRETVGGTKNLADIIAASVKTGIYSSMDMWFMYEPSERKIYTFSGPREIRDFFEELICDELENTDDSNIYTAE